jgi:hypothetical protein
LQIIGRPSVPSYSFQPAPQQVSCVDNEFDLLIASFPLLCLSSDGSRLCPSITEPTTSIPPFFTRSFTLENLADKVGSALALKHSIPHPKDPLLPARHSHPFLLDQSLPKVPVFGRMIQIANTAHSSPSSSSLLDAPSHWRVRTSIRSKCVSAGTASDAQWLALGWTTGDLGSSNPPSPCSQVLRRIGRERLHP